MSDILQIRKCEEIRYYLSVLKCKYNINPSAFVRSAIIEKCQKDIPEIRKEYKNQIKKNCPF